MPCWKPSRLSRLPRESKWTQVKCRLNIYRYRIEGRQLDITPAPQFDTLLWMDEWRCLLMRIAIFAVLTTKLLTKLAYELFLLRLLQEHAAIPKWTTTEGQWVYLWSLSITLVISVRLDLYYQDTLFQREDTRLSIMIPLWLLFSCCFNPLWFKIGNSCPLGVSGVS